MTAIRPRQLSVGIILAESFSLSSFAIFTDLLRLAADEGDRSRPLLVKWHVMGPAGRSIPSSCGARIEPATRFINPGELDYVVVIGGVLHAGPQIDDITAGYLCMAARAGTTLVGVCTGSFVLCRLGLMKSRTACVSWFHYQDFRNEFPGCSVVADRLFVVEGDRITCTGGAGTADLTLHLIETRLGKPQAQKAAHMFHLERGRPGEEAQPHPPLTLEVTDNVVRRAMLLMEQNIVRPLPIAVLAARLEISPRQLERHFEAAMKQTPNAVYRAVRMRHASWLLSNTSRSVTEIALSCGFSDCSHFLRQFKKFHGVRPSQTRGGSAGGGGLTGPRVFS